MAPEAEFKIEAGALRVDGANLFVANTGSQEPTGAIDIGALSMVFQLREIGSGDDALPFGGILSSSFETGAAAPVRVAVEDSIEIRGGAIGSLPAGIGGAGPVTVSADNLSMISGSIGTPTGFRVGPAGGTRAEGASNTTTVEARRSLALTDGAAIFTSSFGSADAGPLSISSDGFVALTNGARISADTSGTGAGGAISVNADQVSLLDGGRITSTTSGEGNGGSIAVDANAIIVAGGTVSGEDFTPSGVIASAEGSRGTAGSVRIDTDGRVDLSGGGQILSATSGAGDGGTVTINAGSVSASGGVFVGGQYFPSGIVANAQQDSGGDAGSVRIDTDGRVDLSGGGQILSATFGAGDGGTVTINAGSVSASGGVFVGGQYSPSGIVANAQQDSGGDAGSVRIDTDGRVDLSGGGQILSATFGAGDGGTVTINAGSVSASGGVFVGGQYFPSGIVANAQQDSGGDAGSVRIDTDGHVQLTDGGQIVSGTFGAGDGGTVAIDAGSVSASGGVFVGGSYFNSGVLASAQQDSRGKAGSVDIDASGAVNLTNGGQIVSATFSAGDGGTVKIDAGSVSASGSFAAGSNTFPSGVLASAEQDSRGDAGSVFVTAAGQLELGQNGVISSESRGDGAAGDIRLRAGRVESDRGAIRTAGAGAEGGRIDARASDRMVLRRTVVTSNGILPQQGTSIITLAAPQIVLNASIVTSLTGDGQPLAGSGEASLLGDVTVISADSLVAGSSSVVISGLQTNLGSDIQLAPGTFLDASRLLQASCAERGAARSTFSRGGRGGLPPSPDRPLPSAGAAPAESGGATITGAVFLDACAGTLVREAKS